ncbi:MAG: GNAT family N-acetyltransferase [Pseudomonadota bacterium]
MISEKYKARITTPESAFRRIKSAQRIFVASGCAEPRYLVGELIKYSGNLSSNEIVHLLSVGTVSRCAEIDGDKLRLNSFFVGEKSRQATARGSADYTPAFLSEIPGMFRNGTLKIDVAIIHVTPPDASGACSYGISVEVVKPAAEAAGLVIAQVNPRMPRTHGDSTIHVDDIDAIVLKEEPIIEWQPQRSVPNDLALKIGSNAARLVDNASTIQVGIGKIPDGILMCLKDKKDLGVHTAMFSDGLMYLVMNGAVNNRKKSLHPGKAVATFCMGTKKLYDFVDDNPDFEFYPCDYVSDPYVIGKNNAMVSINCAIEIDLTGQVCADSIGTQIISGIGSQSDFVRGAKRSEGGRSIIVLPSTALGGRVSRINAQLSPGAGVVTTRGDVQYVVTEYGIANLEGKCLRERALALIEIAHPKFRDKLLDEAKRTHTIYDDQAIPPIGYEPPLDDWEYSQTLKDGTSIRVMPIRPSHERALQRFKYSLSDEDVFLRLMSVGTKFTHRRTMPLTVIDYVNHMAVIAAVGPHGREEIVAVGRYYNDQDANMAEVAFTVHEKWRRRGIGTLLLKQLTKIARQHGIMGFRAEILVRNRAMMRLFHKSECVMHSRCDGDMFSLSYTFDV